MSNIRNAKHRLYNEILHDLYDYIKNLPGPGRYSCDFGRKILLSIEPYDFLPFPMNALKNIEEQLSKPGHKISIGRVSGDRYQLWFSITISEEPTNVPKW